MKVRLLKRLRKATWCRYEIRNWHRVAGCSKKPWRICYGHNIALPDEYTTKEEAIEAAKRLWHDVAEKYLWENRANKKRNKYPW